ncbi:MAG: protease modulator HflC [Pseudomonadales bacterium]|nr:protease modulator HflC [Pseudomonadales bacterium]MDP7595565.1 protease modulator HflC [Pseudomonadales bacterium]HJN50932.1 protease modulator HflC [Pseudomonadales bacterium]
MSTKGLVGIFVAAVVVVLLWNSFFIVTEVERAVLLEFGAVVNTGDISPGLHFKKPFINEVKKFDARVLTLDAPPERYLTLEKKAVIVDSFAKFKIAAADRFYEATSGDERQARLLLTQRVSTGLRNQISKRSMHEVVSGERDQLMTEIKQELDVIAREELGLVIVDIRVKRIDLPPEVSQSVYDRMNTERDIEASEHRAKGQELAVGISADAERQRVEIAADAYRQAEETRGEGDATAAATYANAYNQDPEFYKFYRSLAAYKKTFANKNDILLIDPDSDFFHYLNESSSVRKGQ